MEIFKSDFSWLLLAAGLVVSKSGFLFTPYLFNNLFSYLFPPPGEKNVDLLLHLACNFSVFSGKPL